MRNQYHRTVSELTQEELAELKLDYYTGGFSYAVY